MRPVLRSPQARADIDDAMDWSLAQAPRMAAPFVDALENAAVHIQRSPGTGSPRYALELSIPGMRFWTLNRFPFSLFYIEQDEHLWVIRLVHMSRDTPASLQGDPV